VVIVVLNWNGKKNTIECLMSLKNVDYPRFEIIVVDNASTDGSQISVKETFPDITLIESRENMGFGPGLNAGLRKAKTRAPDYVLCMNNDVIVDKDFLKEMVKVGEMGAKIGGLAPMEYVHDDPDRINYAGGIMRPFGDKIFGHGKIDRGQFSLIRGISLLSGPAMMIKTDALLNTGLFDERFFYGPEDRDIALRLRKSGYFIAFAPAAKIWHKRRGATNGVYSPLTVYFSIRNSLLFAKKHDNVFNLIMFAMYFSLSFYCRVMMFLFCGRIGHAKAALRGVLWHMSPELLPSDSQMVIIMTKNK